jgi:hypothetical protein
MSTHYTVESHIPGIKSWGYLPEHERLTKKRAREVVQNFKDHKMRVRVTRTIISTKKVAL